MIILYHKQLDSTPIMLQHSMLMKHLHVNFNNKNILVIVYFLSVIIMNDFESHLMTIYLSKILNMIPNPKHYQIFKLMKISQLIYKHKKSEEENDYIVDLYNFYQYHRDRIQHLKQMNMKIYFLFHLEFVLDIRLMMKMKMKVFE